ncbi:hypothetical protein CVT26_003243 [Gymnopilus dilepis]|uniref:Uncharacterized protein n=1 Tax=Gymnopilus dilepis TaxID=231916 RepID=A0A409Y5F7_9AGAR|nr:hypothetical protein CVT26_003243 [Gymnopilus dilepis]
MVQEIAVETSGNSGPEARYATVPALQRAAEVSSERNIRKGYVDALRQVRPIRKAFETEEPGDNSLENA